MPINRHLFLGLRVSDPETYQGISELLDYVESLAGQLRLEPRPAAQVSAAAALPPPLPAAGFQVTGADGHFEISIANHPSNQSLVYHELASSTNRQFDAAGASAVFGPENRTQWTIADPAAAKYWRLRSKYLGSAFNAPIYFTQPGADGPSTVASGVLRSASTAGRTQHVANSIAVYAEYLPAGAALQNGDTSDGSPTLDWAAAAIYKDGGATQIAIPKTTIRGLSPATAYAAAWNLSSNAASYSSNGSQLLGDDLIYLATVTTPAAVGGALSAAGGGPDALGATANSGRYAYT